MVEVRIPDGYENDEDLRLYSWFCEEGDPVVEGVPIVELFSATGSFVIPAPISGILNEVYVYSDDIVDNTYVLGIIDNTTK